MTFTEENSICLIPDNFSHNLRARKVRDSILSGLPTCGEIRLNEKDTEKKCGFENTLYIV